MPSSIDRYRLSFVVPLVLIALVLLAVGLVHPTVALAGDGRIPGFSYSAPFEDLKLK